MLKMVGMPPKTADGLIQGHALRLVNIKPKSHLRSNPDERDKCLTDYFLVKKNNL